MTNDTRDGTFERKEGKTVLRFERHLRHPIERVWASITEPDELVGWLAEAKVELEPGGRIQLHWLNTDEEGNRPNEEDIAVMRATITRLDPPHLLEYEGDIHGLLRWELREEGAGCVLTFTNATPAPEEYLTKTLAGWHAHLDFLEDALAGRPITDWPNWPLERWHEHHDRYVAKLGA
jgi:uncharacterized protein YndB with AHSA1/START domain